MRIALKAGDHVHRYHTATSECVIKQFVLCFDCDVYWNSDHRHLKNDRVTNYMSII